MRKIYSLLAIVLLLSALTSCGSDEPNDEQTSYTLMYNRAVDTQTGSDITFSQSTCCFKVRNNGSMTMQAGMILKIDENTAVEFTTDYMPLTPSADENYTYTFSANSVAAGSHTISNLRGKINMVGPTFIQYVVDGRYQCYSTLQPYYTHTSTANTRNGADGAVSYTTDNVKYGLVFNETEKKGTLYLFNLQLSDNDNAYAILTYDNLTMEVTTSGYRLTGADVLPTWYQNNYDTHGTNVEQLRASTVTIDVTQQGQALSGTIKTGTDESPIDITLNGTFFETNL